MIARCACEWRADEGGGGGGCDDDDHDNNNAPVCPAAFDLSVFAADGAQHPTPALLKSDSKQIEQSPSIITHHQKNVE